MWALAIRFDPFRMLDAQVFVDLVLKLAVRMNFVRHIISSANAFLDQPFEIVQILVDPTRNGAAEARGQF